jgi:hypothetical protein
MASTNTDSEQGLLMLELWRKLYVWIKDNCGEKFPSLFFSYSKNLTLAVLLVLFILAGLPGTSISADEAAGKGLKQQKNPYANAELTIKIIPSANKTFGYDILLYGRPLVHQPNIPGLPGIEGFTTEERAQTVAEFVVKKIRNSEMPPTMTTEDLSNMNVLK